MCLKRRAVKSAEDIASDMPREPTRLYNYYSADEYMGHNSR
jgi:hypothetical protein